VYIAYAIQLRKYQYWLKLNGRLMDWEITVLQLVLQLCLTMRLSARLYWRIVPFCMVSINTPTTQLTLKLILTQPVLQITAAHGCSQTPIAWRRGVVETELVVSTKLLYVEPG